MIRDPDTGEVLDEMLDEVALIRVAAAKDKLSVCDVVAGQPLDVARGMAVHLP